MALTFESGTGRQLGQSSDIYGGGGTENMGYGMSPLESQARFGTQAFGGMSVYDVAQNQRDQQAAQVASAQIERMMADPNIRQRATLNPAQYTGYLQEVARREQAAQQRQAEMAETVARQAAIEQQRALERNRLAIQSTPAYQQQVVDLQQLQRDLRDIERRQAQAMPMGMPAYLGFAKQVGLSSLTNQMLGGGELSPAELAARQSQVIRDPLGRAVGFASPSGSLLAGTDPFAPQREAEADMLRDDRPEVVGSITDGDQERCPTGYMFDEDLQACRIDTGMADAPIGGETDATAAYARLGLLDVVPDFSGSAFGDGSGFADANLAFRRRSATRPDIFRTRPSLEGYTLLS